MKQRRIKELTINHYEHGASVAYTPSRTEEYAPVLAQAEAHQDLRFHAEINSVETLIILPWESVIAVYATYETVDVAAPTDTICGGGEASRLTLVPAESPNIEYYVEDGCGLYAMPNLMLSSVTTSGGETLAVDMTSGSDFFTKILAGDFTWRITVDGVTSDWVNMPVTHRPGADISVDCGSYSVGDTVDVMVEVQYAGETGSITVRNATVTAG